MIDELTELTHHVDVLINDLIYIVYLLLVILLVRFIFIGILKSVLIDDFLIRYIHLFVLHLWIALPRSRFVFFKIWTYFIICLFRVGHWIKFRGQEGKYKS